MKPERPPAQASSSLTLEEELLCLLSRQGRRVPIPVFLASLAIAALAYGDVPTWMLAGWLVLVATMLAVRWVVLGRLPAMTRFTVAQRLRIAALLSAINGITHGLSLAFFPYIPPYERAIQSMLLICACAGSVATTAGYMPIFLAYLIPTLGSLIVLWAASPGLPEVSWIEYSTSGLMVLLGAVFVALARDSFRLFRESFEIRLQQSELNRQLEAALEQAETANRAKTSFLAAASHDLRQPAHTLSIFSAALSMQPLDAASRQIVGHMNTAVEALGTQLDALLDISKLDAGVVHASRAPVSLCPLLARLRDEIKPEAAGKLELTVRCPDEAWVESDPLLLERIVRNLLDNAVKYTDSGYVRLEVRRDGDAFLLIVEDSGRGIPLSEQARVFEEFYQLENPERDRTRGLGLGLAIVRRLAGLLGLGLEMDSAPGRGTRFSLALPALVHAPAPVREIPAASTLGELHVLVVDDESEIRIGMKTLLELMGWRVTLAEGTAQAVAAARASRPDLVLADFQLRDLDTGIAAVRAIRALYPEVPALLISGNIALESLREAEQAGIRLLHKPVQAEALKRAIAKVVRQ